MVLTVLCLGLGLWLDLTQRHTAREYLDALDVVRTEVLENRMDSAAHEQAYLHGAKQPAPVRQGRGLAAFPA